MMLAAMLILGFGPLDWIFPWWVWVWAVSDLIVLKMVQQALIEACRKPRA